MNETAEDAVVREVFEERWLDHNFHEDGGESISVVQKRNFDYIAQKSGQHNKILSIHSRNAEVDVIDILRKHKVKFAVFTTVGRYSNKHSWR